MTARPTIDDLVADVSRRISSRSRNVEDATAYAVEDVVAEVLGARDVGREEAEQFIHDVCSLHDIDSPRLVVVPSSSRTLGFAATDDHLLCLTRSRSSVMTVLHEVAHFVSPDDAHGRRFRDSFIRLVRQHVGVEHASLLCTLYTRAGLETSAWESFSR